MKMRIDPGFLASIAVVAVTLGLVGVLVGCSEEVPDAVQERAAYPIQGLADMELYGDPQLGRAHFRNSCAQCHGVDARGSEQGPALIHRIYEPSHHADITFFIAVARGVVAHHWEYGDMPPVSGLDHQEVADIVSWVRHEQREAGIIPDHDWPLED